MRPTSFVRSEAFPTDNFTEGDSGSDGAENLCMSSLPENQPAHPFLTSDTPHSTFLAHFSDPEHGVPPMWSNLLRPVPRPSLGSAKSDQTPPAGFSEDPQTSRTMSTPVAFLSCAERRHTIGYNESLAISNSQSPNGQLSIFPPERHQSLLLPLACSHPIPKTGGGREQSRSALIAKLEWRREVLRRQLEQAWMELSGRSIFALVHASNASRLQYLLEQRLCNVNERDYNGSTPLHVAAHEGNQAIVRVLISFGADVMAKDKKGSTPLDWAAANRHGGVFRFLLAVTRYLQQQQQAQGNNNDNYSSSSGAKVRDENFGASLSACFLNEQRSRSRDLHFLRRQSMTSSALSPEGNEFLDPRMHGKDLVSNSVVLAALPPDLVPVFQHEAEQKHQQEQALAAAGPITDDNELLEELEQPIETLPDMDLSRFSTYTTVSDTVSLIVCMVGLPGRGKSFISRRLSRYLNWKGVACRVFNAGHYRRKLLGVEGTNEAAFFDPNNSVCKEMRDKMADLACEDLLDFVADHKCAVGVFDATNTTRARRAHLSEFFTRAAKQRQMECRIIFIESICTDDTIITENILRAKCGNDDFKDVTDTVEVVTSFRSRIAQYEKVYEPLDPSEGLSFMQIVNVKRHVILHNVPYGLATRITFFLMNLHPVAYPTYIALPGETEGDRQHLYGGDGRLTPEGQRYAQALKRFIQERYVPHMVVLHGTNPDVLNTLKPLADGAGISAPSSAFSHAVTDDTEEGAEETRGISYPAEMLCQMPGLDGINYGRFCGHSAEWVRTNYATLSGLLYTASPGGSTDSVQSMLKHNEDHHMEDEHITEDQHQPDLKTHIFEKSAMAVRRFRHVPDGTDLRLSYCVQFPNGESCRQVNVRLEPVLMAVMRTKSPVFVVASAVPAQGVLAFLLDVLPELSPTLRVPKNAVVEIGVSGEVKVHQLISSPCSEELSFTEF